MRFLDWIAAIVLFLDLPIPVYWFFIHPATAFWQRYPRAAFWVAGLGAWTAGGVFLYGFHTRLFASERAPLWAVVLGFALILTDGLILRSVSRTLGHSRLVGHAEINGTGELATEGLYARMRHPRYTGMFAAVLGACLIAGTLFLWAVVAAWSLLAFAAIGLEERELHARFGRAYADYARRVPRFLPFRVWPREE